jgi:hypothetical protein
MKVIKKINLKKVGASSTPQNPRKKYAFQNKTKKIKSPQKKS